jgi:hypothetical protein
MIESYFRIDGLCSLCTFFVSNHFSHSTLVHDKSQCGFSVATQKAIAVMDSFTKWKWPKCVPLFSPTVHLPLHRFCHTLLARTLVPCCLTCVLLCWKSNWNGSVLGLQQGSYKASVVNVSSRKRATSCFSLGLLDLFVMFSGGQQRHDCPHSPLVCFLASS